MPPAEPQAEPIPVAEPMTVLVTGAAGRMGAHLTRRLTARGHVVRAFVLPDDPNNQSIDGPNVEIVPGRLEDRASIDRAVEDVDAIVALAGALTSRLASDQQFFDANLGGTFNLLMAARDHAPNLRRFIYASSDAVYWSGAANPAVYLPIDEMHPRQPASIYGATKYGAEELSLTFMRAYGIPATIIRPTATADAWELVEPGSVFGRRIFLRGCIHFLESQPNLSADERDLLAALRANDTGTERLFVLADPDGRISTTNLADARDTAAGLELLLTRPEAVGEAFNIGPTGPHGEDELVAYIAQRLDMDYVVIRRPAVRPDWYVSSAKASRLLGYAPARTIFQMVDEAVAAKHAEAATGS